MDPEYFITLEAVIRYIKSGGGNSKYAKKNSNEVFGGM